MSEIRLETRNLCKEYPGTVALQGASVRFSGGEVHALIGKNGAGKSTMVKMLAGAVRPTGGHILVEGQEVELKSPKHAFEHGIATVYQELSLVPHLSVAENILLGRLPRKGPAGVLVDWPQAFATTRRILDRLQVDLDVHTRVSDLGVAQQQIIEIAKAMTFEPSVIMLDEPTSALAHHETEALFDLIRHLTSQGVAIIYITHRLQELKQVADRVTVLRDGQVVGTVAMAETTAGEIVHMMFGETRQTTRPQGALAGEETVLQVIRLSRKGCFHEISFSLHRGEILGIAGLLGAGRTELLRSIFGVDPFDSGTVTLNEQTVSHPTPMRMKTLGLAFTPEDRKSEGLVQILSIRANLCMAAQSRISVHGLTTRSREQQVARRRIEDLDIRVSDVEYPVSSLSGGNQQKVVVGNWLNTQPNVILFDEPTRGIDVHAKQQIFQIMWELSERGISSIFVSSELEELLSVCHRILVMKGGTLTESILPNETTPNELFIKCMEN